VAFFAVGVIFVLRSFYGMRVPAEEATPAAAPRERATVEV
jgi:hypothetical protein